MKAEQNEELWNRIREFQLDVKGAEFPFSAKLAHENGWTLLYAKRAIEEYKKFIYLICAENISCSPSDQLDQVWHLHMLYTESYWKDFCRDTLNREIHHNPSLGGKLEKEKYNNMYEYTINIYYKYFLEFPDTEFWPDLKDRKNDFFHQRVNLAENWVFPKYSFGSIKKILSLSILGFFTENCGAGGFVGLFFMFFFPWIVGILISVIFSDDDTDDEKKRRNRVSGGGFSPGGNDGTGADISSAGGVDAGIDGGGGCGASCGGGGCGGCGGCG